MDKELLLQLLPYLESANDGTAQGNYLQELANDETQEGICLNLVLTWMLLYKRENSTKAPNVIWQEMKTPAMINQIANNQRAYQNMVGNGINKIQDSATFLGLDANEWVIFKEATEIIPLMDITLRHTPMNLICIHLYKDGKCAGGHAIGAIMHTVGNANKLYLFDPNVGVMQAPYASKDELLNKIAHIYETYFGYNIGGEYIFEIV